MSLTFFLLQIKTILLINLKFENVMKIKLQLGH